MFKDRVVLVTGGTGSFGSTIIPKILAENVKELRVFSRDEEKQLDMKRNMPDERLRFFLGDVRDFDRTLEVTSGCDVVYHAAAQKIIPSCEENPLEALKTNVVGTLNVREACVMSEVDTAVLLSTDKAVKPINFYGMTKALAEKLWVAKNVPGLRLMVVRYGNVIGSRGSVIPYFKRLVSEKKPLPITSPKMTRFLITLERAHELVFYVTQVGKNGGIYVPDIPACNILTLAEALAGKRYPIKIVGIREGEKINECLINEYEMLKTKKCSRYYVIDKNAENNDNGFALAFKEFTSDRVDIMNAEEVRELLREAGEIG